MRGRRYLWHDCFWGFEDGRNNLLSTFFLPFVDKDAKHLSGTWEEHIR